MPTRPPHVCPGCGDAVTGRCPTCAARRAWTTKPRSWSAGSTRRWRRFRAEWLAEHPMCAGWPNGTCSRVGQEVDHIIPLGQFGDHEREQARFDRSNVQTLCKGCHGRKTAEEAAAARKLHRAQDTTGQLW